MKGALSILVAAVLLTACTTSSSPAPGVTTTSSTLAPVTTLPPTTTIPPPTTTTTTTTPQPPSLTVSPSTHDIVDTYVQVVEGKTDPLATVMIDDEPVAVTDDGLFSANVFNRPGGNTLVVTADSADAVSTTNRIRYTFVPPIGWAEAIGDSVMLGAKAELELLLESITVDAAVSRQFNVAPNLVKELVSRDVPPEVIIIGLGTNGPAEKSDLDAVMKLAKDIPLVVFVNVTVTKSWESTSNDVIAEGVARYDNAVLVDWHAASKDRPALFVGDGIHPRPAGSVVLAQLIAERVLPADNRESPAPYVWNGETGGQTKHRP